jgi:diacylglycerol kinase
MSNRRGIVKSFKYAYDGYEAAFKYEPNFRVHLITTCIVTILGIAFQIQTMEWIILCLTIAAVIILELINTAIEKIVDLASPRIHPKAKIAKDVSAAAVLTSAIAAIIIGGLIFGPRVILLFKTFLELRQS